MADPRFHHKTGPYTVGEIARAAGAELYRKEDEGRRISDVASLADAGASDLSFLDNKKYRDAFIASKAGACIVLPEMAALAPAGMAVLTSAHPYRSYARAAQLFYPEQWPDGGINERAIVASDAKIGTGTMVEMGAIIKSGAVIGDNCWIEAGAIIAENVIIGNNTRVGANAAISHALIGNHVHIYPGVAIGQRGFGFAMDPGGFEIVPQLGRVIVEDHVEIGANSAIDRGAGPDTVIGQGTMIDNLVQIAHNVRIGKNCVIVAQNGIAGSTELGNFVISAGQVGIAGHLKIGDGVRIAAKSGVMRNIAAGEEHMGYPSMPIKKFMRGVALLAKLGKKDGQ